MAPSSREIEEILLRADQNEEPPRMAATHPSLFLRRLYDAWVQNGGKLRGKNRNSIAMMQQRLREIADVKSLASKLSGRTRLKRADVEALVTLFLKNWTIERDDAGRPNDDAVYRPFPSKDVESFIQRIAGAMFPGSEPSRHRGILLAQTENDDLPGSMTNIVTTESYGQMLGRSNAFITISRHQTVFGHRPIDVTMERFWHIFRSFADSIDPGSKDKVLIWIVDLGSRNANDRDAWLDFKNIQFLKMQFEAFAAFDVWDIETENAEFTDEEEEEGQQGYSMNPERFNKKELWSKLESNTVIIVKNLRPDEKVRLFGEEYEEEKFQTLVGEDITPEHLLPRNVPIPWLSVTKLLPENIHDLSDLNLTVTVTKNEIEDERSVDVRYYTYSLTGKHLGGDEIRQFELASPGRQFDRAMVWACRAARYRLSSNAGARLDPSSRGRVAIGRLRRLGFEVLSIRQLFDLFPHTAS